MPVYTPETSTNTQTMKRPDRQDSGVTSRVTSLTERIIAELAKASLCVVRLGTESNSALSFEIQHLLPNSMRDPQDDFAALTDAFEGYIKARGAVARDNAFQRLLTLGAPDEVLAVARSQYAKHGNDDRLVLAADLLARMGATAFPALDKLTKAHAPDLLYFVPTITSSSSFTTGQKRRLLERLLDYDQDDELMERAQEALDELGPASRSETASYDTGQCGFLQADL